MKFSVSLRGASPPLPKARPANRYRGIAEKPQRLARRCRAIIHAEFYGRAGSGRHRGRNGSFWVVESALGGLYSRGLGISLYSQFHEAAAEEFQNRDLNESFGSRPLVGSRYASRLLGI